MKILRFKKYIIAVCIVAISVTAFQPRPAQALFPDWVNAAIQVIGHGIQGALLGIDSAANTISAGLDTVKRVMDGLPIQYGPVRKGLSITMASCDLLGGNLSAAADLDNLISPTSPSYDPRFPRTDPTVTLGKLPPLAKPPTPTVEPAAGAFPDDGDVKGDTTTYVGESMSTIYKDKLINENSTVLSNDKSLTTPIITQTTKLDPLAEQLVSIGDKTKTNLMLSLTKQLGLQRYAKTCFNIMDSSMKSAMIIGAWNEQLKQALEDSSKELDQRQARVNQSVGTLEQELNKARHEVFQALGKRINDTIAQQRTTDTIAELKPKVTVANYEQTLQALTLQVYAPKKINTKYANDPTARFVLGQLLDVEIASDSYAKKQSMQIAEESIKGILAEREGCFQNYEFITGSNPLEDIERASSNIQAECNFQVELAGYQSKLGEILAESKLAAQAELNSDQGYRSTRPCMPVNEVAKQQMVISAETARKVQLATAERRKYEINGQISDPKYIEAINAEKQALAEIKSIPVQVNGGVVEPCGDIDTSGALIKSTLDSYTARLINPGSDGTDNINNEIEKSDNLPQIISGMLFGSLQNPKSFPRLIESGTLQIMQASLTGSKPVTTSTTVPTRTSGILGDSTEVPSNNFKIVPYTSPRGDFGVR